jgi:anti-sigma factor RsiW
MSDCRRTADRLAPYVDDMLPSGERAEVDRHLEACPPCRASVAREQGGRAILRECAPRLKDAPLPPGLRTRCAALAREHDAAAAAPWWRARLVPATISAALVLFTVLAVLMLAVQRSNTVLAAQLTADHDRCFRRITPPPGGLDAAAEETRLSDAYGWDIHIPPSSAAEGIKLVGARRCLLTHGGVPHLLYEVAGHEVSLYVFEGVARPQGEVSAFNRRSRIWSSGPSTYVLVSPDEAGDMARVVSYLQQAAH